MMAERPQGEAALQYVLPEGRFAVTVHTDDGINDQPVITRASPWTAVGRKRSKRG